ncbi:MAG: ATP-binding protein [Clostridia bacterium]|nr:ATP-binding protein [Clostridia bacterium]
MEDCIKLHYVVDGQDFVSCGRASEDVKRTLKSLGISSQVIRKVAIAMYEGEVNMVIHADGGIADVGIYADRIEIVLSDKGKGIADIEKAMQEGYSTATEEIRELGFGAGMGLPNMKKYTDDMTIESELNVGTTITMRVNIV